MEHSFTTDAICERCFCQKTFATERCVERPLTNLELMLLTLGRLDYDGSQWKLVDPQCGIMYLQERG